MSLTRTDYYRSDLLAVRHVACRSAEKQMSNVEQAEAHTLVLPLRGAFMIHFNGRSQLLAEPTSALMFRPGSESRISHPVVQSDECFAIELSESCLTDILEMVSPLRSSSRFITHSYLKPAIIALRNLLWFRLSHSIADSLETEEIALMLISYCVQSSREIKAATRKNSKILKQVEMAKALLFTYPGRNWTLASLAQLVTSSPFHLTRTFRELVGVPLHRYLLQSRLATSIDRLLDTRDEITTIALDLGFSSHSHFTASFRRTIGMTPAQFRVAASARSIAETRNFLISQLA